MNQSRRKLARDDVDDAFIRRLVIFYIKIFLQYELDQKMFNFLGGRNKNAISKKKV